MYMVINALLIIIWFLKKNFKKFEGELFVGSGLTFHFAEVFIRKIRPEKSIVAATVLKAFNKTRLGEPSIWTQIEIIEIARMVVIADTGILSLLLCHEPPCWRR